MSKLTLLALLFVLATPAFAKPYLLPCNDLWSVVIETLRNQGNYKIVATDAEQMKASFIVVGALYPGINLMSLKPKDSGCELEIQMGFTGNDDEFALRNRVSHAVAKRKAAKPSPPPAPPGAGK